jgi:hypothetical protein
MQRVGTLHMPTDEEEAMTQTSELATNGTGNALAVAAGGDIFKLGEVLFQSGYFADVKSASQAIVKILRGQELGIGPIQSMENISVIKGRTSLGAALIGAKIKSSGKYDYLVNSLTDTGCELIFFQSGKEIGRSSFDANDARKAGLDNEPNYKKFPRNMFLARALTNGARWYCPDVFGGPVYDPSELRDIKEPEMTIETATIEQPQGNPSPHPIVPIEQPTQGKRPRTRKDLEDRYGELLAEAVQWNADDRHDMIEFRPYNESWTDDELRQFGVELATSIDRVKPRPAATSVSTSV